MSNSILTPTQLGIRGIAGLTAMAALSIPLTMGSDAGAVDEGSCDQGAKGPAEGHVCLDIAKSVSASTAGPGDTLTYTITATNSGTVGYDAKQPASFADDMAMLLDDASYVSGSAKASEGSVGYTPGSGISWSDSGLAPGATATITYQVTVNNPDKGDGILTNTVVSDAMHNNCMKDSHDAACSTTTYVTKPAPLASPWVIGGVLSAAGLAAAGYVLLRRRSDELTDEA